MLVGEALQAGLLLSRSGERIHVDSPLGRPLPEGLKERLVTHRAEVLAWLDWVQAADELLMATSQHIASLYPRGCPLDDEAWSSAEAGLQEAHRSQDLALWRAALAAYERFAFDYFASFARHTKESAP
jgi:hypothetical protein